MSTTTNIGDQVLFFDYKNPLTSKSFNNLTHGIIPFGIYNGLEISINSDTEIGISAGQVYIQSEGATGGDPAIYDDVGVNIFVKSAFTLACDNTATYVCGTFNWANLESWYMAFELKTEGLLLDTDIIIGKLVYDGTSLDAIDYSMRSTASLADLETQSSYFKITPQDPISNTVDIGAGVVALTGTNTGLTIKSATTLTLSAVSSGQKRVDLIYLDESGDPQYLVGTEDVTNYIYPELISSTINLAYIKRDGSISTTTISGDQILKIDNIKQSINNITLKNNSYIGILSDADLIQLKSAKVELNGTLSLNLGNISIPNSNFIGCASDTNLIKLEPGVITSTANTIRVPDGSIIGNATTSPMITFSATQFQVNTETYISGNLGVGNSSPSERLDVTGNALISGTLGVTGNTTLGTAGITTANITSGSVTSSTNSTSKDTGALIITAGGLGVEQNIYLGGNLNATGTVTGGAGTSSLDVLQLTSSTNSTSKDTGALILTVGGLGVEGNGWFGGYVNVEGAYLHYNTDTYYFTNASAYPVGSNNIGIGHNVFNGTSTTSSNNVGIGTDVFTSLTSGKWNTALGYQTGENIVDGDENVTIGHEAGDSITSGNYNIAIGSGAMGNASTASNNTIVGRNAFSGGTGSQITCIGSSTGSLLSTGTNVTCIGYNAEPSSGTVSNEITLGDSTVGMVLRCVATTITAISDERDKTDISIIEDGLKIINDLTPKKYKYDIRSNYENNISDGSKKAKEWTAGFIAQDLQKVQKKHNIEWLGLVYKVNPERLEASPGKLLPIMVKAIQELSSEIDLLKKEINKLKK
jgi:trimeric autotransporter adhesin